MALRWLLIAALTLSLVFGSTARAQTLLFAGGEDTDFICNGGGGCSTYTDGSTFRAGWARESYGAGASTLDPPTNRFATPTFSANSTLWIHAQYCTTPGVGYPCNYNAGNDTTSNAQMLRVLDSAGNPTIIIRGTGAAGQLKISSRTASGTFTDLVTCSPAFNITLTQLDLYINYSASGEVALYNNSQKVCDFTGNITNGDGATTLNDVEFSGAYSGQGGAWSEVIIATSDTRAMSRFSAYTVANGNSTGFSGTNICSAIWNATSYNDANFGYSGANNVLQECTIKNPIPAGSYSVVALVMSARALVGATGPQHFAFLTRTNGTDYTSPDFAPLNSFSNIANYIQTVNPATGDPWAISDFEATGFNVGEETIP